MSEPWRLILDKLEIMQQEMTEMKANVATKEELEDIKNNMATKQELENIKARMATKEELEHIKANMATKEELEDIKENMATKAELNEVKADMAKGFSTVHQAIREIDAIVKRLEQNQEQQMQLLLRQERIIDMLCRRSLEHEAAIADLRLAIKS
ncbi:hypothetical protein B1690_16265 [Geobacillus sp. 46C-IIa]|uniref:hypothetical protein n=1 Tax=Geobacillus sp. 46C-IIa TaxID=1963025 RepID=UPI0009BE77D4|nr:hypothetical protein [Geobacillus sp. 46C-IIa]OQP04285.1 hypothetical protein B1690_16265 [Geobacillus sp. 46C-IIa]QNU29230.1 hypothetical protein IC803_06830 [Geobacillus sp. 46C-IIa]